jgi:hypothetical protein
MKAVKSFALGAVGLAALVGGAAPASAQYYGSPYGGYQYGYPTNIIGQVIQSLINPYGQFGYNRGVNPQVAVQQCTAAVQQRLYRYGSYGYGGQYGGYGGQYGGYGGYGGYGYNSPYAYGGTYGNARILGITRVEQRSATTLRVRGFATSGRATSPYYPGDVYGGYGGYGGSYGAYGGYGYAGGAADLSFKCDVDYRGYVRDVDIDRRY